MRDTGIMLLKSRNRVPEDDATPMDIVVFNDIAFSKCFFPQAASLAPCSIRRQKRSAGDLFHDPPALRASALVLGYVLRGERPLVKNLETSGLAKSRRIVSVPSPGLQVILLPNHQSPWSRDAPYRGRMRTRRRTCTRRQTVAPRHARTASDETYVRTWSSSYQPPFAFLLLV